MKCKLTKVKGGKALRTDTVEGSCVAFPEEGACFEMIAQPLDPLASFRAVNTSPIVKLVLKKRDLVATEPMSTVDIAVWEATTMSGSVYEIEVES